MQNSTTYSIANMRAVPTTGKVKEKNPDRLLTVYGEFRHVDEKGKPKGDPLTITQKVVTREDALSDVFAIDVEAGLLTLPTGERGRKAVAGASADEITNLLASIREGSDDESDESDADNSASE